MHLKDYLISKLNLEQKEETADKEVRLVIIPLAIWVGTQEEYDAILNKDASTLYLIKES